MGSSQTRDWTHVPCIGRWIRNHCTTREVLKPVGFSTQVIFWRIQLHWELARWDLLFTVTRARPSRVECMWELVLNSRASSLRSEEESCWKTMQSFSYCNWIRMPIGKWHTHTHTHKYMHMHTYIDKHMCAHIHAFTYFRSLSCLLRASVYVPLSQWGPSCPHANHINVFCYLLNAIMCLKVS